MNNFKLKILTTAFFAFGLYSHAMASIDDYNIAAVIPFEKINQPTDTPSANTTTPAATQQPTVPNQTQVPATNQNNLQLNATGGGGMGTSNNAGNRAEQNDLYNRGVNNMLNGK
jgi:hypothetical protein